MPKDASNDNESFVDHELGEIRKDISEENQFSLEDENGNVALMDSLSPSTNITEGGKTALENEQTVLEDDEYYVVENPSKEWKHHITIEKPLESSEEKVEFLDE